MRKRQSNRHNQADQEDVMRKHILCKMMLSALAAVILLLDDLDSFPYYLKPHPQRGSIPAVAVLIRLKAAKGRVELDDA